MVADILTIHAMNVRLQRKGAFTLIELLIVITIIGILAVALIPRLTGGPARARDAQRMGDLQQISTALEFYSDDNSGYPPASACLGESTFVGYIDNYLTTVPHDPSSARWDGTGTPCSGGATAGENDYSYIAFQTVSGGNAEGYLLIANLENNDERGSGVYIGGTSGFSLGTYTTARDALSGNTQCTSLSVTGCASSSTFDAIFVIGR